MNMKNKLGTHSFALVLLFVVAVGDSVDATLSVGVAHRVDEQNETTKPDLVAARATLAAFSAKLSDAKFIAADYRQIRETFLFGTPIISKGRIQLRREPACLRMDVREPKAAIIRSDATSHLTWHAGKERAERLEFKRNETAVTLVRLLTGEVKDLEKLFEIRSYSSIDGVSEIGLVPLDKQVAEQLTRLALSIDAKTALPIAVEYENLDGEKVRIELTSPVLMKELKDARRIFEKPLPEHIKIVTRRIDKP